MSRCLRRSAAPQQRLDRSTDDQHRPAVEFNRHKRHQGLALTALQSAHQPDQRRATACVPACGLRGCYGMDGSEAKVEKVDRASHSSGPRLFKLPTGPTVASEVCFTRVLLRGCECLKIITDIKRTHNNSSTNNNNDRALLRPDSDHDHDHDHGAESGEEGGKARLARLGDGERSAEEWSGSAHGRPRVRGDVVGMPALV